MLFSVRLTPQQPDSMADAAWQEVNSGQLTAVKALHEAGTIKAIYRETGVGVLAIFDVADAQQMDQELRGLPMFRYFASTETHALWDMAPALGSA
jgi:muconolactone delta-isomerase